MSVMGQMMDSQIDGGLNAQDEYLFSVDQMTIEELCVEINSLSNTDNNQERMKLDMCRKVYENKFK